MRQFFSKKIFQQGLIFLAALLFPVVGLVPAIAHAADATTTYYDQMQTQGIAFAYTSPDCQPSGKCTFEDVLQVFVNITNFILATIGSLVLGVIIWGGMLWLTSAGNSEQIEKGKKAMSGSVIGLLIIFGAFMAINFLTGALRGGTAGQENKCELVSPTNGGQAGTGYACINTSEKTFVQDEYTCLQNLCPGPAEIQCCLSKAATTTK